MKKGASIGVLLLLAGGAYIAFSAMSVKPPVDIGDGDYDPPEEGGISFLVNWNDPIDLKVRSGVISALKLRSRGASGTMEVLEYNFSNLPTDNPEVSPDDPEWRHVIQNDIFNNLNYYIGSAAGFIDVYEA